MTGHEPEAAALRSRHMNRIGHRLVGTVAAMLFLACGLGTSAADEEGHGMQNFVWKNRPVVVVAPAADDPLLTDQVARLSSRAPALAERDMVVITVADSDVRVDGKPASGIYADALRARFGIMRGERAVLLIGKDGGVKLRRDTSVAPEELFALIDSMPMRRREMRESE